MTGRLCPVQALARFRVIQPSGEFGFASENHATKALRRFMALRRALIAALR
jgi:hypothetical protein